MHVARNEDNVQETAWVMTIIRPFVTDLLADRPHCEECLAQKTGMGSARLRAMLDYLGGGPVPIIDKLGRCGACGRDASVYRLAFTEEP